MKLSSSILVFSFLALVISSPLPKEKNGDGDKNNNKSKDSKASAAASGGVLTSKTYDEINISDGKAGNAAEEAAALFKGIDMNNLASVSADDVKRIKATHDLAEKAEVNAFNSAIESASGDEADALKNGKIKNKVLKTSATVLALQIEDAQGNGDAAKLEKEKAKMNKNIELDKKASGQASKGVKIGGST